MKFRTLMARTLSKKTGLLGLILSAGGLAAIAYLGGSGHIQSVPPFVAMLFAFVSMAGTRMLTAAMNQVRADASQPNIKQEG